MEDTFKAIALRAHEIFESAGRELGPVLENWVRAERELLHPVRVNITELEIGLEPTA